MSTTQAIIPPPAVVWAQRSNCLLVTINLEDCKNPELKLDKNFVHFKGVGGSDQKLHEVTINLFKEIDPEKSKTNIRDRSIEMVLVKASTEGPWWPKLTAEKEKQHWLKSDFNKWRDEDDSEGDMDGAAGGDFEEMMRQMGGLGAADVKPSLDDLDAGDGDSDDEDIPDLE